MKRNNPRKPFFGSDKKEGDASGNKKIPKGVLLLKKKIILLIRVRASSLVKKKMPLKRNLTKEEIQKVLRTKELQKVDFLKTRKRALREDLPLGKSHPIGRRKNLLGILPIALKRRSVGKEESLEVNSTSPVLVQSAGISPDSRRGSILSQLSQKIKEVEKIFRRIRLRLLQVKNAYTREEERTKSLFMGWNLSNSMGMHQQRKEDLERIEASLSS